jgi:uncharacterized membrane protein YfcA
MIDIQATELFLTGVFTGFVDSIAGGGGLISLPVLTVLLGPGAQAIGTNKVAGSVAASVALLVYWRAGYLDFKKSFVFAFWIACGAFLGSRLSPHLPLPAFRWILVGTCPLVLGAVLRKNAWVRPLTVTQVATGPRLLVAGILCGVYDGAWGPGAGTFMLLALFFLARLPLLTALAASKLANSCSALVALGSYAIQGYVHWKEGLFLSFGVLFGAFIGAHSATYSAERLVRPVLVVVVGLLMARLIQG